MRREKEPPLSIPQISWIWDIPISFEMPVSRQDRGSRLTDHRNERLTTCHRSAVRKQIRLSNCSNGRFGCQHRPGAVEPGYPCLSKWPSHGTGINAST